MQRFCLLLEWDGRGFMGWQRQAHGPTVQAALEAELHAISGEAVTAHAAGRTDSGVHARAMPVHVDLGRPFTPFRLMEALNARLAQAGHRIAVLAAAPAPSDFHARFSCIGRAYRYHLVNRRAPLTHLAGLAWRIARPLDSDRMAEAARLLVGRHDFTTFRSVHCQASSAVRTLDRLDVRREGADVLIEAAARSFLHHQVRSMTGALVMVGLGRWATDDLARALEARDRAALALNAPPDGLWFMAAAYPPELDPLSADFTIPGRAFG